MQNKKKKVLDYTAEHKYISRDCIALFANGFRGKIHNANECVQPLRDLLRKDHIKGHNPFVDEVALDMDKLEELRVKGHSDKSATVDYIVGLEKNWILFVEAKLDADKPDNFAKELKNKWIHSRELKTLSDVDVHEEKDYVVLLKDDKFEQNRNRLWHLANGITNLKAMRVMDFYTAYFKI